MIGAHRRRLIGVCFLFLVRALTDEDIERALATDPDAALLDAAWFASACAVLPPEKEMISIRLDKDVLNYFRSLGPYYQTRINA